MAAGAVEGVGLGAASSPVSKAPVFYYDFAHPECYLVAEQISATLPEAAEWVPVRASAEGEVDRGEIERLAVAHALQRFHWPEPWPPRGDLALRAATYAKSIGRVVAFSLAAFRQAYAAGRDLDSKVTAVIAGAACEIHPVALLKAIERRPVAESLARATAQAATRGVDSLPAICVGELVFSGEQGLVQAARALGGPG